MALKFVGHCPLAQCPFHAQTVEATGHVEMLPICHWLERTPSKTDWSVVCYLTNENEMNSRTPTSQIMLRNWEKNLPPLCVAISTALPPSNQWTPNWAPNAVAQGPEQHCWVMSMYNGAVWTLQVEKADWLGKHGSTKFDIFFGKFPIQFPNQP